MLGDAVNSDFRLSWVGMRSERAPMSSNVSCAPYSGWLLGHEMSEIENSPRALASVCSFAIRWQHGDLFVFVMFSTDFTENSG